MDRLEPLTAYTWDMSYRRGTAPTADVFREEDPSRPTVCDLIRPGQLVRTNYGTGPYRVEDVQPHSYFGRVGWTLTLSGVVDGVIKDVRAYTINEVVVEWEGETPFFRHLFRNNDDEVILLDGSAFRVSRAGQLSLF